MYPVHDPKWRVCLMLLMLLIAVGSMVQSSATAEPPGGMRPIVLASGPAIRLPVPPAADSPQRAQEVAELRDLQAQRTVQTQAMVEYWQAGAVVRWNEMARQLVSKYTTNPPMASRVYALLSVAQYDALLAVADNAQTYTWRLPEPAQSGIARLVAPTVALSSLGACDGRGGLGGCTGIFVPRRGQCPVCPGNPASAIAPMGWRQPASRSRCG